MSKYNPPFYLHEAVDHYLNHAAEEITNGGGLVGDFDYNEEVEKSYVETMSGVSESRERIITLELTYIIPEQ